MKKNFPCKFHWKRAPDIHMERRYNLYYLFALEINRKDFGQIRTKMTMFLWNIRLYVIIGLNPITTEYAISITYIMFQTTMLHTVYTY